MFIKCQKFIKTYGNLKQEDDPCAVPDYPSQIIGG